MAKLHKKKKKKKSRTTPKELSRKATVPLTAFADVLLLLSRSATPGKSSSVIWMSRIWKSSLMPVPCAALHPPDIPQGWGWGITPLSKADQGLASFSQCFRSMDLPALLYSWGVSSKHLKLFQIIKILTRPWTPIRISQFLSHCPQY